MQGLPVPQPLALVSMIVASSAMVGNRQSQWLLNPPVCVLPSELAQFPTPVAPPFSVFRKLVNAVPFGAVATVQVSGTARDVVASPDGRRAYVSTSATNAVVVLDTTRLGAGHRST